MLCQGDRTFAGYTDRTRNAIELWAQDGQDWMYPTKATMTTEQGEELSTREIKAALRDIVDNEDKRKPLSDEILTQMLSQRGYPIARRTVAKYREQLGIPVARLRK